MSPLCWLGVHRKVDRRRWYSRCRHCRLPLFGPRNEPITDHVTLRLFWQALKAYEFEESRQFPALGVAHRRRTRWPW